MYVLLIICRNASLYIGADFRPFLVPVVQHKNEDSNDGRVGGPNDCTYTQGEARFVEIGIENGVLISPGTICQGREYGWFCIIFTVELPISEGLRCLAKVFDNFEVSC